jgi:hypothetical protein
MKEDGEIEGGRKKERWVQGPPSSVLLIDEKDHQQELYIE